MCFYKSKESKILVAKRNIIVYKLGCFADSDIFNPVYNESYCYYKNKMTKENVYFNDDTDAKIIRWLYIDDLLLLNNNQNHA